MGVCGQKRDLAERSRERDRFKRGKTARPSGRKKEGGGTVLRSIQRSREKGGNLKLLGRDIKERERSWAKNKKEKRGTSDESGGVGGPEKGNTANPEKGVRRRSRRKCSKKKGLGSR